LQKTAQWLNTGSLVDVVKTVLERIDNPDVDYLINPGSFHFSQLFLSKNKIFFLEVAEEYAKNRTEFNRKALEIVTKHSLPRN
jgi:hypothetical protein